MEYKKELSELACTLDKLTKQVDSLATRIYEECLKLCTDPVQKHEFEVILKILEEAQEDLQTAKGNIAYETKKMLEGTLAYVSDRERYKLNSWTTETETFSCGMPIEIFTSENDYSEQPLWIRGSIQYTDSMGGYYFYSDEGEKYRIQEGMRARVRQ